MIIWISSLFILKETSLQSLLFVVQFLVFVLCLHILVVDISAFLWCCSGVSSFNQFIYELSVDSDTSSVDYSSAEEDSDRNIYPASPSSQSSRVSGASTYTKYDRHRTGWIRCIFFWILLPAKFLMGIPVYLYRFLFNTVSKAPALSGSHQHSGLHSIKRVFTLRDQIVHRTTDRRRGVIEVCARTAISYQSWKLWFFYHFFSHLMDWFACMISVLLMYLIIFPGSSSSNRDFHRSYFWCRSQGSSFYSFPIRGFQNTIQMGFILHWAY